MIPETENQQGEQTDETSVVVDLTESDEKKQVKPLTAPDDKAGDKGGEQTVEVDASTETTTDDDEISGMPKKFGKRLKREMRQKVEARSAAAAEREAREASDARAEAAEAEVQRLKAERRDEPPDVSAIDTKIDAATAKLEKALEDGDTKLAAQLNRELADLSGQKHVRLAAPKRQEQQRRPEPAPVKRGGMTATGKAFVEANDEWWSDPEHAAARSAVVALDAQLIKQGSDPNSEGHYQRIAKKAKAMGLKVKILQPFEDGDDMGNETTVDLEERREQRRQPPQGGNGNGNGRVNTEVRDARAGKVILTDKDKETMRVFKLDPTNPAHLRAFAKSRQEVILQGAQS